MNETNAFDQAAAVLGKVEKFVVSGNKIIESVESATAGLADSTKTLQDLRADVQAARDVIDKSANNLQIAEVDLAKRHKETLTTLSKQQGELLQDVEKQMSTAFSQLRDLEKSMRSSHKETMATTQREIQGLLHESRASSKQLLTRVTVFGCIIASLLAALIVLIAKSNVG